MHAEIARATNCGSRLVNGPAWKFCGLSSFSRIPSRILFPTFSTMSWPEIEEVRVAIASEENGNSRGSKGWINSVTKGNAGDGSLNMVVDGD